MSDLINRQELIEELEKQVQFYVKYADDETLDKALRSYYKWVGLGVARALGTVREMGVATVTEDTLNNARD